MPTRNVAGLEVQDDGHGPAVLMVHGTAADRSTWALQRPLLRQGLRLLRYDRRGVSTPLPAGREALTLAEHAEDAAAIAEALAPGERVLACGSSFGSVVLLELLKARPDLVAGALLMEPPIPPSDAAHLLAPDFLARFDAHLAAGRGEAASEFFLRFVLGDAAFEKVAPMLWTRALARWPSIRQDIVSLSAHRVDYPALARVEVPVLLLGGARSRAWYADALDALERTLPHAQRETVPGAGHLMQADAPAHFNARLQAWAAELGLHA